MKTTRETHDRCLAARRSIKTADPELFAQATARAPLTASTPEHSLMLDLSALDAVASGFATGFAAPKAQWTRAMAALSRVEG